MALIKPDRKPAIGLKAKVLFRVYRWLMGCESMPMMALRRKVVNSLIGGQSKVLNIFPNVFIEGFEGLVIGESVSINRDCNISAAGGLEIGNFVGIGHRCSIMSGEHDFRDGDQPMQGQGVRHAKVVLNDNVLIGANSTILAGISIASGCFVAAGSLVTKSFSEPDKVIGGIPARIIGSR
jgi:acetyltransferase-like isoleucine patch superfamily enzyme